MPYFDHVKRFCFFLASGRSGHSIIAHLLSAHPKVMICDELAAVSYFEEGYTRDQVFALIKYQDYRHQSRDRKKSGYFYYVENAWQNVYEKYPEVIGDAKGSRTTNLLADDDRFIDLLRARLDMPIRVLIHMRNPYDTIATRVRRRNIELPQAIDSFMLHDQKLTRAAERLAPEERHVEQHENLISEPAACLTRMYEFLEVDPMPEVVDAAAQAVWTKPNLTRNRIQWPRHEIDRLEQWLAQSHFAQRYAGTCHTLRRKSITT